MFGGGNLLGELVRAIMFPGAILFSITTIVFAYQQFTPREFKGAMLKTGWFTLACALTIFVEPLMEVAGIRFYYDRDFATCLSLAAAIAGVAITCRFQLMKSLPWLPFSFYTICQASMALIGMKALLWLMDRMHLDFLPRIIERQILPFVLIGVVGGAIYLKLKERNKQQVPPPPPGSY